MKRWPFKNHYNTVFFKPVWIPASKSSKATWGLYFLSSSRCLLPWSILFDSDLWRLIYILTLLLAGKIQEYEWQLFLENNCEQTYSWLVSNKKKKLSDNLLGWKIQMDVHKHQCAAFIQAFILKWLCLPSCEC